MADSTTNKTGSKKRGLGVVKKNEKGTVYLQLNKDIEITVKGQKLDLGEYRTIFFSPVAEVLANVEKREAEGTISERAAEVTRSICSKENVKYVVEGTLA